MRSLRFFVAATTIAIMVILAVASTQHLLTWCAKKRRSVRGNFGWLPSERALALAHVARVIRGDDGQGSLAQEFSAARTRSC